MKTLRYLLIAIGVLSVVSVMAATFGKPYQPQRRGAQYAQNYSEMPTLSMSTMNAAMMSSGSALPMAAVTGTTTADQTAPSSGPNRAKRGIDDDGFADTDDTPGQGDTTPPELPGDTVPIGDAVLPLMLMACAYFIWRRRMVRSKMSEGCERGWFAQK